MIKRRREESNPNPTQPPNPRNQSPSLHLSSISETQRAEEAPQPTTMEAPTPKHTCLKLELQESQQPIFVKGTWFPSRFELSITDGLNAWICSASEDQVSDRAAQWDQPVSEYVALAERYLGFQHPDSVYGFADAGDGYKRVIKNWSFLLT